MRAHQQHDHRPENHRPRCPAQRYRRRRVAHIHDPATDRSMPRVTTTNVCAMPASTIGMVLFTVEVSSNPPEPLLLRVENRAIGHDARNEQEHRQFEADILRQHAPNGAPVDVCRLPRQAVRRRCAHAPRSDDLLGCDSGASSSAAIRAFAHHQHAVAKIRQFLRVAGIEQDRAPFGGQPQSSVCTSRAWCRHPRHASRRSSSSAAPSAASGRAAPSADCRRTARRPGCRCSAIRTFKLADHVLRACRPLRARRSTPARHASRIASVRLSRTLMASIRPSVLRSSGTSAMRRGALLRVACVCGPAARRCRCVPPRARSAPNSMKNKLAMALPGEAADTQPSHPGRRSKRRR